MCVWISRFVNGMWLGLEQCSTLPASQHSAVREREMRGLTKEKMLVEGVIGLWFRG